MSKKYLSVGILIVLCLILSIQGTKFLLGPPPPISLDPAKTKGAKEASIYLIEFSDFECPYCQKILPILEELLQAFPKDLKVIFKQFPLGSHGNSFLAAKASECAANQDQFWKYHNILFGKVEEWHGIQEVGAKFTTYAAEIGLDVPRFEKCLRSPDTEKAVQQDIADGEGLFVDGTPTLILNGRKILTNNKLGYLKKTIQAELEKQK